MFAHSSIQLSSNCILGSSTTVLPACHPRQILKTPIRTSKSHTKLTYPSARCNAVMPASAPAAPDVEGSKPYESQPAGSWRLYTCRMPLIGLEAVASALEGTPIAKLLQLHTYLLLEGPNEVRAAELITV
jgi:hypothetical protein